MGKFKAIWGDPVWSKVISAGIIGLVIFIYNQLFGSFWKIKIPFWSIILVVFLWFIFRTVINKISDKKEFFYDEKTHQLDIDLFEKIRNDLLTHTNVYWLRTNNFAGYSFEGDYLSPFDMLEFVMDKPDFEFFNPNIETIKSDLMNQIRELNIFMLGNIFTSGPSRMTVPPEWEEEQPERFNTAVSGIHSRAHNIGEKYDEFIRSGRKNLKVA
jgi:hypothetical protein